MGKENYEVDTEASMRSREFDLKTFMYTSRDKMLSVAASVRDISLIEMQSTRRHLDCSRSSNARCVKPTADHYSHRASGVNRGMVGFYL